MKEPCKPKDLVYTIKKILLTSKLLDWHCFFHNLTLFQRRLSYTWALKPSTGPKSEHVKALLIPVSPILQPVSTLQSL